jgi:2-oxo-4-hydroxy-4-carboxy-5-ureidoimidazoline decarboxylase
LGSPATLDALNAADPVSFVAAVGDVFEHAPWVAEAAAVKRPFATVEALHKAMFATIANAPETDRLAFIRNHPELGGREAVLGQMTLDSVSEQGSAGLDRLAPKEFQRFTALNAAYRERFGFPFLICVRRHTRASILREFERRIARAPAEELEAALAEILAITRLRITQRVQGAGMPQVNGRLSTHVLDTVTGRPAAGVVIELRDVSDGTPGVLMARAITNADGRTDAPLIGGQPLRIGTYEIAFHMGPYFAAAGYPAGDPAFLEVVPIRFAISEPEAHYHVPLLATPWSYSTYRGS